MAELLEWKFDPREILASKRKVKGIFHKAIVDKDDELITPDAIKKSIPDYMHLPALHDFHKERPVGLATKIWQEKDGSFGFEGVIKSTEDCDDIWEKISKGNYDHVSIFGRRTEGNQNCSLPQGLRTGPCITNGVRLDSISVCDDNARNDSTSLSVKKAQLIWDGMDMIQKADVEKGFIGTRTERVSQTSHKKGDNPGTNLGLKHSSGESSFKPFPTARKAETAESSNLMHTPTDYAEEKKCPCSKKKYKVVEKGTLNLSPEMTKKFRAGKKVVRDYTAKQDSEDASEGMKTMTSDNMRKGDDMDVEKGGWETHGINETEALHKKTQRPEQRKLNEKKKKTAPEGLKLQKGDEEEDDVEKGTLSENQSGKGNLREGERTGFKDAKGKPGGSGLYTRNEEKLKPAGRDFEFQKGDEEDDEMSDEEAPKEMEKGKKVKKGKPVITEEPADRSGSSQNSNADIREPGDAGYKGTGQRSTQDASGRSGLMRKGDVSEDDADDEDQYDEEKDSSKKKVSPKDKEGNWAKDQPGGSDVMKKGEKEQEIDTETRGKDAKKDMEPDDDEDDKEVEKGTEGQNQSGKGNLRQKGSSTNFGNVKDETMTREGRSHEGVAHGTERSQGGKSSITSVHTSTVHPDRLKVPRRSKRPMHIQKGESMDEDEEVSQEYVTKAMVPIEEVDTIIKARTEEISKAYTAQFDEIKKAYDAKIAELTTRVDKMSEETIRKGGNIVVIPQLLDPTNQGFGSNADALAKITAGK